MVVDLGRATLYCSALSVAFVGSLYCLVPSKIRQLDRDDARQIRWRSFAALVVSGGAMASYHWLFCDVVVGGGRGDNRDDETQATTPTIMLVNSLWATGSVLLHTTILYFGPILTNAVQVYAYLQRSDGSASPYKLVSLFYATYIQPKVRALFHPRSDSERWVCLRNLVIAPLTEEIVFRACMVPVLESALGESSSTAASSAWRVPLTAPLFFGVAHVHHAVLKIRQGNQPLAGVLLGTALQFAYTSLFGAYVSYAYSRTRSLAAVTVCHALCNGMGLPNVSFLSSRSPLYPYRIGLAAALVAGMVGFGLGIARFDLPPSINHSRMASTTAAAAAAI